MIRRFLRRMFGDRRPVYGPPIGAWFTDAVLRRDYLPAMREQLNATNPWLAALDEC